jgi:hypothetical protein
MDGLLKDLGGLGRNRTADTRIFNPVLFAGYSTHAWTRQERALQKGGLRLASGTENPSRQTAEAPIRLNNKTFGSLLLFLNQDTDENVGTNSRIQVGRWLASLIVYQKVIQKNFE